MSDLGQDPAAETQLTLLGSARDIDDTELAALYAYPADRQRTWVRANFITSLDGGATASGRSGGLAGPGDRAVFKLLRTFADVILVGAGTVRIENYGGAQLSVTERQQRQTRGQSEVPPLAIVTKSGRLDRNMRVFTQTEVTPLVLTCAAVADDTRRALAGVAEVVACSGADPGRVDETAVLTALGHRGLHRVLTEGGPTLLGSLIDADLLDELCLTIAPRLVGGTARRIATGPGQVLTGMRCAHLLSDAAGYLYTRYVKGA
ncbi:pyrimidine reductase family protein [Mycobacterium sp. pUA109]|uniref:pyrimidine reductase family protein n=1 Tax=Mycobacterium sp. pUA109 TaxID=3238982 RepID=UPI00351BC3A8